MSDQTMVEIAICGAIFVGAVSILGSSSCSCLSQVSSGPDASTEATQDEATDITDVGPAPPWPEASDEFNTSSSVPCFPIPCNLPSPATPHLNPFEGHPLQ